MTEYPLPTGFLIGYIATGPDGNVWFTGTMQGAIGGSIGYMTVEGVVTLFVDPYSDVYELTASPYEPIVWYMRTIGRVHTIARISTAGDMEVVASVARAREAEGIAVGPDRRVWYTRFYRGLVGALSTDPFAIQEYPVGGLPYLVTAGSDCMWVALYPPSEIAGLGRMGVDGTISITQTPSGSPGPFALGADGSLWLCDGQVLLHRTAQGSFQNVLALPALAEGMTRAASGQICVQGRHVVTCSTDTGLSTHVGLPDDLNPFVGLVATPDGSLWVGANVQLTRSSILRLVPPTTPVELTRFTGE